MSRAEVPITQETAAGLDALRQARRRRYLSEFNLFDAFYRAYFMAIAIALGTMYVTGQVHDTKISARAVGEVLARGPGTLGIVGALAVLLGLKSGSRGGPLAFEPAEVQYVLLAPIDRGKALRGPAFRQIRSALFTGAWIGALTTTLISRRFPWSAPLGVLCGTIFGALSSLLFTGSAMVASGKRFSKVIATGLGTSLLVWSAADLVLKKTTSPTSALGWVALSPIQHSWRIATAAAGILIVLAVSFVGLRAVSGVSLEQARRRAQLVSQLRFALTIQDLRSVVKLRRELSAEEPRSRPWFKTRRKSKRMSPIWHRDWQALLRWPASRVLRMLFLAAVAGIASIGVWQGTTALIAVAGAAMYVAALDGVEGLAQELDHPTRRDLLPVSAGDLSIRHLAVSVIVCIAVALLTVVSVFGVTRSTFALQLGLITLLPASVAAVVGASISVSADPMGSVNAMTRSSAEIAGVSMIARVALPPAVAVGGLAPVLAARFTHKSSELMLGAAIRASATVLMAVVIVAFTLRYQADKRYSEARN